GGGGGEGGGIIGGRGGKAAGGGLAVRISAGATFGTTAAIATATATVTKAIAMTTLQKILISGAIVVAAGAGIYEARQASQLRQQNDGLEQKHALLAKQIEALQRDRDESSNRLAMVTAENAQLRPQQSSPEVLKLRAQVGMLRRPLFSISATNGRHSGIAQMMSNPAMREYIHQVQTKMIRERYEPLIQELKLTPENAEKFTQLIGDIWAKGAEGFSNGGDVTKQNVRESVEKANK